MATPAELLAAKQKKDAATAQQGNHIPKAKKESKVPKDETKEDRFKRIVVKRTKLCIKFLNNIGNCANTTVYGYTPEQVKHIFDTIQKSLDNAKEKFEVKQEAKQANEFSL